MRRTIALLTLTAALLAPLGGCAIQTPEDLYALPRASVEYESLQGELQRLLDSGLEYAAPLSGSSTQPVQDVDLNGDGVGEAVAFFRDTSGEEGSLRVYVFAQNADNEYEVMTVLTGQGSAVSSVTYSQLDETDNLEIVISWQISSGIYALSAYSVWQGGNQELLAPQTYTRYAVCDLDGDGQDELVLLQLNTAEGTENRADYYRCVDGSMARVNQAYLSSNLSSIDRINASALYGGEGALYVTGTVADDTGGESNAAFQLTDVLAVQDGVLVNITRDETAGSSESTRRRTYVADQDLDGDGVWEIPALSATYERREDGSICVSETFYLVSWMQYDLYGGQHVVCTTYYNSSDGWYLVLPEDWQSQIALARSDFNEGRTVERGIQFYRVEKVDPEADSLLQMDAATGQSVLSNAAGELFMTIYKNTGSDRATRAAIGERTVLTQGAEDAVYSVEFFAHDWSDWTGETVEENLHIIVTNWSSD